MGHFFGNESHSGANKSSSFKLKIKTDLNEYGIKNDEWSKLSKEEQSEIINQANNC